MTRRDFFSADDFGGCLPASRRIADYVSRGWLQSVSIFGNCTGIDRYLSLLPEHARIGIHLDLTEGFSISGRKKIPLLVKPDGRFQDSFFRLLFLSLVKPKQVEAQVYTEIRAQLDHVLASLPDTYEIRIDSHRHFHMIPVVFRTLCRVLQDTGRPVSYIRFPSELTSVYLATPSVWRFIRPVNLLKVLVLKACGFFDRKYLSQFGYENCTACFCGVMFSGHMTMQVIRPIRKKLIRAAGRQGRQIEFLFHPGWLSRDEQFPDRDNPFLSFYESKDRRREAAALSHLNHF